MKKPLFLLLIVTALLAVSCSDGRTQKDIEMYTQVWDEVINNGKTYKTKVVHEWTLENEKIKAFQQYIGQGKQ